MAIATLLAGLLMAGSAASNAGAADYKANAAPQPAVADEIEVAAIIDNGDPVQLLNRGVEYARQGDTDKARALFTRVADNRMRYQMETADGSWADSRVLARKALGMLDRGEFTGSRMAKAD